MIVALPAEQFQGSDVEDEDEVEGEGEVEEASEIAGKANAPAATATTDARIWQSIQ